MGTLRILPSILEERPGIQANILYLLQWWHALLQGTHGNSVLSSFLGGEKGASYIDIYLDGVLIGKIC